MLYEVITQKRNNLYLLFLCVPPIILMPGRMGNCRHVTTKTIRFCPPTYSITEKRTSTFVRLGSVYVEFPKENEKANRITSYNVCYTKLLRGDPESQRDVRLALYHLYAFSRENSRLSIAPMGLSSQGYNGHIFWDSELWMFPPLLALNQEFAKSMLDYRFDRLGKAAEKAANYGFKGAMFPWESDDTGEEATPTWALTGTFEHHITADVGIACWNYYRLTGDLAWLKSEGFPFRITSYNVCYTKLLRAIGIY